MVILSFSIIIIFITIFIILITYRYQYYYLFIISSGHYYFDESRYDCRSSRHVVSCRLFFFLRDAFVTLQYYLTRLHDADTIYTRLRCLRQIGIRSSNHDQNPSIENKTCKD